MPPDEGVPPEVAPPAPESASTPTDADVAQNWFDQWSGKIEERLGHLEQAITHVAQSQQTGVTDRARPTPNQPSGTPPARTPPQGRGGPPPPVSQPQQQISQAPAGEPAQPEHAPKPGHWYFKRIWGGN